MAKLENQCLWPHWFRLHWFTRNGQSLFHSKTPFKFGDNWRWEE